MYNWRRLLSAITGKITRCRKLLSGQHGRGAGAGAGSPLKRQVCILLVLVCLAVISTVLVNSGGIGIVQRKFVTNYQEGLLQQDQSLEQKTRSGMSTLQSAQTFNKSSTCALHIHHTNYTSCPQCFRPATVNVANRIHEIGHMDHLIPDKRPGVFTPAPEIVERVIVDYLIVPQVKCPYLLAIQPSVLDRRKERDLVRSTWGSVAKTNTWPNRNMNAEVKVVFVVARQTPEESSPHNNLHQNETGRQSLYLEQIQSEAGQHNDILFIDMIEGYRNLTLKLLSAFKWLRDNCPCVRFVLKVDLDTFVNVPLLVDTLIYSENRLEFSILGMVYMSRNAVMRSGRWGVNASLYPMACYPEYASGITNSPKMLELTAASCKGYATNYISPFLAPSSYMSCPVLITWSATSLPYLWYSSLIGCGYVVSMKALSDIVDTVPHYRMFPVEDAFITGVMRRVVGFQLFSMNREFTHYNDKHWHSCQMFQDNKVLGLTDQWQTHQIIWDSFMKGHCS